MDIQAAIARAVAGEDLADAEMESAMRTIMQGGATPAQIAGFLVALRMKGETVIEIAAAARVMRSLATGVDVAGEHLVDIVGTGGDGSHTFNISTTAALIAAATGVKVVKHGNRSASSKSGSADVLEKLGVKLETSPQVMQKCLSQANICFAFARSHHPAMKFVAGARTALGIPTIFNLLGPLTNPAGAKHQLLGVFAPEQLPPGAYDVVLANILAQPLVLLAPLLAARTRAGGRIVLSGILQAQAEEVAAAYAPHFEVRIEGAEEGWSLVQGTRR